MSHYARLFTISLQTMFQLSTVRRPACAGQPEVETMKRFTALMLTAPLAAQAADSGFGNSLPEVLILAALIIIGLRFLNRKLSALLQTLRMKNK